MQPVILTLFNQVHLIIALVVTHVVALVVTPTSTQSQMEDLDKRDAMEAINVLERFSLRQAEQEIREKMDKMRDAIMRGARLSEIQVLFFIQVKI